MCLSVCLGGRLTVNSSHSPGSLFPVGETLVQYTATDAAGNSRTCNLTVTVQGIKQAHHIIKAYNLCIIFAQYIQGNLFLCKMFVLGCILCRDDL